MEASMNVANMKPCGMSSSLGLKAGVQRNTKVYMEPSKRDCIAPSSAIFSSDSTKKRCLLVGVELEAKAYYVDKVRD